MAARIARSQARLFTATLLMLPLCGCWGAQWVRAPAYTEETRADVMDMAAENKALRVQVDSLRAAVAEQTAMLRSLRAQASTDMGSLRETVEALEARMSSQEERRARPAAPATPPQSLPLPADTTAPASAPDEATSRAAYDSAYLELLKGNYDLAVDAFESFLTQYPQSDLADNAQYWIGECHLAQGDNAHALSAFLAVESKWPSGDKVPGSLLKVAHCLQAERKSDEAKRTLESVIKRFPNTEEARLAQERLARLSDAR